MGINSDCDYVQDGLIYCGKCHTPKQVRLEINGKTITLFCLCKCEAKKLEAEKIKKQQEEWERHIRELRKMGFPDTQLTKWDFEHDDHMNEKVSAIARNYVEHFSEMKKRGKGLLFYGSVGTGKTFISACIANALIENGHPCLMTNFARLTNTISGMYQGKQEYIDGLDKFELLVIDDFGAERDTEYMGEIVQNIIDARYRSGLPLIVTTNFTAVDLKKPADIRQSRIFSRLFEMCMPVEVIGKDKRKEKLRQEFNELGEILGL